MAQKLHNFITKLKALDSKANMMLLNIVNNNKTLIEDANRDRLAEGKNIDGSYIFNNPSNTPTRLGSYSRWWAEIRKEAGRQIDYVDLKYKGNLYNSIKYRKTKDGGEIISTDTDKKKIEDIDRRYGQQWLGLTEQELDNLAIDAAENLATLIAQKISD